MTFSKTVAKLAKLTGQEVRVNGGRGYAAYRGYAIDFLQNGAGDPALTNVATIHVQRATEVARPEVDYFPGSYAKTISQAVRWVNSWTAQDAVRA